MTATKNTTDHATPVAKYLEYLNDPASILDTEAIEAKEKELAECDDVLTEIEIRNDLLTLTDPSSLRDEIRQGFLTHAKPWADSKGIRTEALVRNKIPTQDLVDAGFDVKVAVKRTRGPVVRADVINNYIPETGSFTVRQIQEGPCPASPGAVRNYINREVAAGNIKAVTDAEGEPVLFHSDRGRGATQYEKV